MPQNYTYARLRVAANAAAGCQQIVAGVTLLEQAAADLRALATLDPASGSGTFLDSDFLQQPGLSHLSVALLGELLGPVLAGLQATRDTPLDPSDASSATLGKVFRSCQRGLG